MSTVPNLRVDHLERFGADNIRVIAKGKALFC